MSLLPPGILVDILRSVGRNGFRGLQPFINGSKATNDAAIEDEVFKDVEIDEFIFVNSLANEDSAYRQFCLRCFNAGNTTTMYLEGLQCLVLFGPSDHSLWLLKSAEEDLVYAKFAYGIFSICCGFYEAGMDALRDLYPKFNNLREVLEVADIVMASVVDMEPRRRGIYRRTYRYPFGDIPDCVHYGACNRDDVCFECLGYFYSGRIRHLC